MPNSQLVPQAAKGVRMNLEDGSRVAGSAQSPSLFSRARSEYGGAADTTTWLRWCRSDFVAALSVCHEEVFASPIKSPSIKNCLRRRRIWIGGTLSGGKVCTCADPDPPRNSLPGSPLVRATSQLVIVRREDGFAVHRPTLASSRNGNMAASFVLEYSLVF